MSTRSRARLRSLAVLGEAVWAVVALTRGDPRSAAVAAGAAALLMRHDLLTTAFAAAVAALLGEWSVAAIAIVPTTLASLAASIAFISTSPPDMNALALGVDALPTELRQALDDDTRTLTTVGMVTFARNLASTRWAELLRDGASEDPWDGPLVDPRPASGAATLFAAEACSLARLAAEHFDSSVDVHLLAACALAIADSAAQELAKGGPADALVAITGAHELQVVRLLVAFARQPTGSDTRRRVQLQDFPGVPRELRFRLKPREILVLKVIDKSSGVLAVGWVIVSAPVAAMKALRRIPTRVRRMSTPWSEVARAGRRTRRESNLTAPLLPPTDAPVRPWSGWSTTAKWLWLGVRPACTLAVIGVAFAALPLTEAIVVALGATIVRPLSRQWAGVTLAAGLLPVSPLVSALLTARVFVTEVALQLCGRGARDLRERRRQGLNAAREARRALANVDPVSVILERLNNRNGRLAANESPVPFDNVIELAVSTWCESDVVALLRLPRSTVAVLGSARRTTGSLSLTYGVGRLARIDRLSSSALRFAGVVGASVAVSVFVNHAPVSIGSFTCSAKLIAGTLAAWIALGATARRVSTVRVIAGVVVAVVLLGSTAVIVAASLLVVVPVRRGRTVLGSAILNRRAARVRSLGIRETGIRWHGRWDAATIAAREDMPGIAIALYREIAADCSESRPTLAAVALARTAVLELGRGRVDQALVAADQAEVRLGTTLGHQSRTRALASVSVGEVQFALGQDVLSFMPSAVARLPPSWPETARASAVCADALVRAGRAEDALALLSRARGARSGLDFIWLLESEVAVANVLTEAGRSAAAIERLEGISRLLESLPNRAGSRAYEVRLVAASGRAAMLHASLELEGGDPDRAVALLERAVTRLEVAPVALRAAARVAHGAALAATGSFEGAVSAVERGVALIEAQRRQITRGEARSQAIRSEAALYRSAFATLRRAEDAGVDLAGEIAARLIEALHQSALARTLRERHLHLGANAASLMEQVAAYERALPADATNGDNDRADSSAEQESRFASLRRDLGAALSDQFARAYLPDEFDLAAVRDQLRSAHVLSYYLPQDGSWPDGFCVWIPPSGKPCVHEIRAAHDNEAVALLEFLSGADEQAITPECLLRPVAAAGELWSRLGSMLLPPGLRAELLLWSELEPMHLLIVPDRAVARVPFAALLLDDGRMLVEVASTQLVPSLELVDATESFMRRRDVLFHGDPRVVALEESGLPIVRPNITGRLVVAATRTAIDDALKHGHLGGAYFATHGFGQGLEQYVELGDRSRLSAASALSLTWPAWVVLASCFVGAVEHRTGAEPLGFPIGCLLGGASSVIGGVIEVGGTAADRIARITIEALDAGERPAGALRRAQLALKARPVNDWAAFCCISRVRP
jgi:tetratricopeptide (TPR) repeat protein